MAWVLMHWAEFLRAFGCTLGLIIAAWVTAHLAAK